jgi:hypothetical protein
MILMAEQQRKRLEARQSITHLGRDEYGVSGYKEGVNVYLYVSV